MRVGYSDSYNYTFHSLGSIGAIILLGYIVLPSIEKYSIMYLHFTSLLGIMTINQNYFQNFKFVHFFIKDDIHRVLSGKIPNVSETK
jgi:hypothetical protein